MSGAKGRVKCPDCGSTKVHKHQPRKRSGISVYRYACKNAACERKTFTVTGTGTPTEVAGKNEIGSNIETDGYEAHASVGGEIRPTEQHLREVLEIADDWACIAFQGRAWPSGDKQMYYGRGSFVPRKPVKCEWPTVRPAEIKPLKMQRAREAAGPIRKALVACDAQIGFRRDFDTYEVESIHDQRAFALLNSAIVATKPDVLVLAGDMLDLPDWSDHFVQSPEMAFSSQLSVNWFASWLRFIRPYCGRVVYIFGNHEARMTRNVINNTVAAYRLKPANLPEAPPVLSIENLLGLEDLDVEYISDYPQGEFWLNDNLRVIHGTKVGAKSGQTVMKMLDGARASVMQGHVHRQESAHVTSHAHGKTVTYGAYSLGTLARIDGVVPGSKGRDNWQQGFAVVDYTDDLYQVQPVNIWGNRMIFDGQMYAADQDSGAVPDDQVKRLLAGIASVADFGRLEDVA